MTISDERLRAIAASWGPAQPSGFKTPAAHIAREQVLELVAEVRRLRPKPYVIAPSTSRLTVDGYVSQCVHQRLSKIDRLGETDYECTVCGKPWEFDRNYP